MGSRTRMSVACGLDSCKDRAGKAYLMDNLRNVYTTGEPIMTGWFPEGASSLSPRLKVDAFSCLHELKELMQDDTYLKRVCSNSDDGMLDRMELRWALRDLKGVTSNNIEYVTCLIDLDGDGKVPQDELKAAVQVSLYQGCAEPDDFVMPMYWLFHPSNHLLYNCKQIL